jgi:hypothetical protein
MGRPNNGLRRTIAGASAAESIETSVLTYPELQQSWLRVNCEVVSSDQPTANAEWLTMQLSVGDKSRSKSSRPAILSPLT